MWIILGILIYLLLFAFGLLLFNGTKPHDDDEGK